MAVVTKDNVVMPARGFYGLPLLRQFGLMAGLAASVAIGVAVVLWSQKPSYRMLYSGLAEQDSAAVTQSLQKSGIPYELADGAGTVMVPADQVHEARLKLAGEGLPKGVGAGFELLDNQKGFGVSQFMENARYQRALEGELAQTIASISSVRAARVHLAIPKQTAFVRSQKKPTASVMVDLYSGRGLDEGQVAAIGHMVAASIPNLDVDQVTIVDQQGRLLTQPDTGDDMRLTATQFDYRKRIEAYYTKRIEDIVTPIAGLGAVKAQVNADLDFTVTEETQESFNPNPPAVRSEQTVDEKTLSSQQSGGVPGSLSNQAPSTTAAAPAAEAAAPAGSSVQRTTRNYEIDKTISHTKRNGAAIKRLSAAVVIDDRTKVDEDGETVREPLSEEEIARITNLVKEAIGFDTERGDSVNVINQSFTLPPAPEELPEPSMLSTLNVWDIAKQALGIGVVLFLIFGVLRPVLRELAAKGKAPPQALPQGEGSMAEDQLTLSGGMRPAALPAGAAGGGYDSNLNMARTLASQDPKRTAQVVRNWVAAE
ncbi:MAG: flagellar M-ring protein FliF [Gammaproteobacteria bacterium]|nr:flagellar M-ring protein FliF [Gammaproteobacteria bacterium]